MARVEAGEDSDAVPVAVPVTTSVKGSPAKPGIHATAKGGTKPTPPERSKLPLYLGIGAAAAMIVGLAIMATRGGKEAEKTTPPEPAGKPTVADVGTAQPSGKGPESKPKAKPSNPKSNPPTSPVPPPKASNPSAPPSSVAQSPAKAPATKGTPAPKAPTPTPTPEPAPEPVTAKAAPAEPMASVPPSPTTPAPATEAKPEAPKPAESLLAAIPGFRTRADGYLSARKSQVSALAANYLRGLDARLNQAADGGNLTLAKAFRDEHARVEALQQSLNAPVTDPVAAMSQSASLPDLPEGSPTELSALRQTWETERQKIRDDLDAKLRQSLQTLEAELTKAREFEKAEAVVAYREGLGKAAVPAIAVTPEPTKPASDPSTPQRGTTPAAGALKNPFGWKPIPENPFPLKRAQRPTTPCRVVAWRLDGLPVDEAAFRQLFGGVPADLGDVVDLTTEDLFPPDTVLPKRLHPVALKADGSLASFRPLSETISREVVQVSAGRYFGIALHADGTASPITFDQAEFKNQGIDLAPVAQWKDLVAVSVGFGHALGLKANGEPMAVGLNNDLQSEIPEAGRTGIVSIAATGSISNLLKVQGNRLDLIRFGTTRGSIPGNPDERVFLGNVHFFADDRGELIRENVSEEYAVDLENLRGGPTRDVRAVANTVSYNADPQAQDRFGLAAAREGDDQWRFWGDRGSLGKYDNRYCDTQAAGCWKVFFIGDYVLALKPVSNLKPDDWTGKTASSNASTDSRTSESLPVNGALKNPFGWQGPLPQDPFPLMRPTRPTTPCRVVAWRLDGKPVEEAEFRKEFGGVPAEMGEVVDLASTASVNSRFYYPLGLTANGRLAPLNQTSSKLIPPDLAPAIQISGGRDIALALHETGRVSPIFLAQNALSERGQLAEPVREWEDIVTVSTSGVSTFAGIDSNGNPVMAGENKNGQCDIPGDFRNRIVAVLPSTNTWMVKHEGNGVMVHRFGLSPRQPRRSTLEDRIFLAANVYVADKQGRLTFSNIESDRETSIEQIRGAPRDVREVIVAQGNTTGVAALREGEQSWRFWGNRGNEGGFEVEYCESQATGCWKLYPIGDYVIALKPVANMKPDDWTGKTATSAAAGD
ncbi:MAG: hypothetical protein KDM64_08120 [Verrucomicrobiae bacterium]|nr:hypothetical protein [Verrucomicrobiae bacterium]